MIDGCSDPLASNYSGDDCANSQFIDEACEYTNNNNCADDDSSMTPLDCATAVAVLGCEGTWNDLTISDACPESCDNCNNETSCELENIDWNYVITDGNMTVQIGANVITINGENPPVGALLGAFFLNPDNNQYTCAGYLPWTGDQLAIAVWKDDTGSPDIDGLQEGMEITWLLQVGNQTFLADSYEMNTTPPFSETFVANGFGQLLSAEYNCEISGIAGSVSYTHLRAHET